MGKYFGTDGFRGEANVDLDVTHAFKIGRFLGWYYTKTKGRKSSIVIGKDTRRSSYMFEYALATGVTASGADAYLLHVTTTPSVAYVTRADDFDCGIMISASHNPYYDNGIKLLNENGEKMEEGVTSLIESYLDGDMQAIGIEGDDIPLALRDKIGCTVDYFAGRNRYIGFLISIPTHSFRRYRVGLDCANGSAWQIAKSVFDALGADTFVINSHPDGTNINQNAGSTHIEVLQKYVLENKLDVGFAYDGDADRCLAVDEHGNAISGDKILYIYGRYMKERGKLVPNAIVTTVMSNLGLYKALDEADIGYVKTDVGDRFVYEEMRKGGYRIGGEQSGHIIFTKYATTGDGILTSIKLMEVMCAKKMPLSKLAEPVQDYPQILKNIEVADKESVITNERLLEAAQKAEEELGDDGRVLIRASGTEPKIRIMVEAKTLETCQKYVDKLAAIVFNLIKENILVKEVR